MPEIYLNGQFVAPEQAMVPVTDRGLLFGDSVCEVIPVFAGAPFRAGEHLARLQRSLAGIRLASPLSDSEWQVIFDRLCADLGDGAHALYLQITRGSPPQRAHRIPAHSEPTVIVFTTPIGEALRESVRKGIRVNTLPDTRWHYCELKTTNLLPNVLAQSQAIEQGADDAILIRDGEAREGTSSNLFVVMNGLLITPPDCPGLLPGITRDLVLELAEAADIPFARAVVSEQDLIEADEIWLTSSTREIAPVTLLNGKTVGSGEPGPIWQRMDSLYQAEKQRHILQVQETP